jgi:uncharacterized membrane protein YhaH (DUF805 family)
MNGEGVRYPAFLLGGSDAKPMAFSGPEALFVSGRFRGPLGPMTPPETLVDSSGRTWTFHAVTAIGRWGSWDEWLRLWWGRRYLFEYDATEGPAMSLDELKAWMLERHVVSEAALRADTEVDEQIRQYFLDGWSKAREELVAAATFKAVAETMGPRYLYQDNWFSGRGRSNRAEYLAVLLAVIVVTTTVSLVHPFLAPAVALFVIIGPGLVFPIWLIGAVAARRAHDLGWKFSFAGGTCLAISVIEVGAQESKKFNGDPYGLLSVAVWAALALLLAILPGTPRENRYDPQPNPGPSL